MSRLWSDEEDDIALRCYAKGESIQLIASKLKRTKGGVRARLRIISDTPSTPIEPDTNRLQAIRRENENRVKAAHDMAMRS